MAGPLEAIISAILGRQPNPGSGGSPYPEDYQSTYGRMRTMNPNLPPEFPSGGGPNRVAPRTDITPDIRAKIDALKANAAAASQPGSTAGAQNLDPMAAMNANTYQARPEGGPSEAVADTMDDEGPIPGDSTYDPASDQFTQLPPKTVDAEVVDTDVGGTKHGGEVGAKGDKLTGGGGGSTITVKKGDSLWRIATQVAGSKDPKAISAMVKQIAEANGIANPDQISVGMKLNVPEANVPLPRIRPGTEEE